MPTPQEAKLEFKTKCRKPDWSKGTHKTLKAVGKTAASVALGIGAVGIGAAIPIALPAWAPLTMMGAWLSAMGEAWSDIEWAFYDAHDEDIPVAKKPEAGKLDRSQIRSIVDNQLLSAVAPNRAGTRGKVDFKDILPAIISHYQAAKEIMQVKLKDINPQFELTSCHDAEKYYKMLANLDYHLSKMKAYAEALHQMSTGFKNFCDNNAANLQSAWKSITDGMEKVMDQNDDWHKKNCPVLHTCYRTGKLSRVFS